MNPLNFYIHPNNLDYEKDVDPVGRDLIKQINQTDYMRTTMYCSGHFKDEDEYPWMEATMNLCYVVLDIDKCALKICEAYDKIKEILPTYKLSGFDLRPFKDEENNNELYWIGEFYINYETKENRQKVINILKEILV